LPETGVAARNSGASPAAMRYGPPSILETRMDSIDAEMTEIIDRFRIADHRHTEALRQREKYQHQTYKTLRRVPLTADSKLEQLCRSEDSAWTERDELLDQVIETPARTVAAIAIKLRFALNHGRLLDETESVEADADIVLSALRDAERLAARLP
jgi:hypothetical protein